MNILKKVFFSIVLLVCCSSKTFFLLNKTSYDVMVEFWYLSNENREYVKGDILRLPAHRSTDILSYEDTKYPPASTYMLKLIFVDKNKAIIHTSLDRVFLENIEEDTVILLSEDFRIKFLEATAPMKEAVQRNTTMIPLDAPFFWGGSKAQEFYQATNVS